jgi:zinc D-Ala-D-Ala dipeptidase
MSPKHWICIIALAILVSAGAAPAAAPALKVTDRFAVGEAGGWDYLAVDADTHRLFVSRADRVMVLDTRDGKLLGTIPDTAGVHSVVLVPALGRGFTSNGRANTITEFNLADLKTVRTIAIDAQNPDAMLYDAFSGHLFTFNGRSHDATIVDAKGGKTIATIVLGGKPEFAVSDGHGKVYVNIEDTAEMKRIDTRANTVDATWKLDNCTDPTGLAIDSAHARLFSVCQNGRMAVTDARTGKAVAGVAIGAGPDAATFDAARGLVFSSNGEDGTLTVIEQESPDTYRVLANVPTQKSARTMALDEKGHRIYLVAAEFDPAPPATEQQPHPRPSVRAGTFTFIAVGDGDAAAASGEFFHIQPVRPVAELLPIALAQKPPVEAGEFRAPDLVEVTTLDPTIRLDIRYATTRNFLGTPLYSQARAFLQRPAAEAVVRVQRALARDGYGLLIHDAYRPWYVTRIFWDATPPDKHNFVADPAQGSRHNRGCAVDLTLYDLKTGRAVEMPSLYDEMSDRAYPTYAGGSDAARHLRDLLRQRMEAEGFTVYEFEWWHFDYKDWKSYGIQNVRFEDLAGPARTQH